MGGLLINGQSYDVDGVLVVGQHENGWAHLSPGDCRPRAPGEWIRQYTLHKTIADDPEQVLDGVGPPGGAERTVTGWQEEFAGSHRFAGAALTTDHDGTVFCLCDLATVETFHATVSNAWSIGHETCELPGGRVYQAALDATCRVAMYACQIMGIQLQVPKLGSYTGHPIKRMLEGGPDMVGIFGHRDNTEARGRWDPGDTLFQMLVARGCEQFDFASGEDRDVWGQRQRNLNEQYGLGLTEDGVPGPKTVAALKQLGYTGGIWALGIPDVNPG